MNEKKGLMGYIWHQMTAITQDSMVGKELCIFSETDDTGTLLNFFISKKFTDRRNAINFWITPKNASIGSYEAKEIVYSLKLAIKTIERRRVKRIKNE